MEEAIENTTKNLNNCYICERIKKDFEKCNSDGESYSVSSESVNDEQSVLVKSLNVSNGRTKGLSNNSENYASSLSLTSHQAGRTHSRTSNHTTNSNLNLPKNRTFSTDRLRDIERKNAILVEKILYHSTRPNRHINDSETAQARRMTSSEINRRRLQEKISRENEMLLKKIQSVKPCVKYKK